MAAWHPTGTIFFVGSVRGEIQVNYYVFILGWASSV